MNVLTISLSCLLIFGGIIFTVSTDSGHHRQRRDAPSSQCPMEVGLCVTSAGIDQNSGVTQLNSDDGDTPAAQATCLAACLTHKGATGCEVIWGDGNRGCYVHTEEVAKGNGALKRRCWVLSKCTVASDYCKGKSSGIYPNPTDCHNYITCTNGLMYIQPCPGQLHFNPEGFCDFPANVPCDEPIGPKCLKQCCTDKLLPPSNELAELTSKLSQVSREYNVNSLLPLLFSCNVSDLEREKQEARDLLEQRCDALDEADRAIQDTLDSLCDDEVCPEKKMELKRLIQDLIARIKEGVIAKEELKKLIELLEQSCFFCTASCCPWWPELFALPPKIPIPFLDAPGGVA